VGPLHIVPADQLIHAVEPVDLLIYYSEEPLYLPIRLGMLDSAKYLPYLMLYQILLEGCQSLQPFITLYSIKQTAPIRKDTCRPPTLSDGSIQYFNCMLRCSLLEGPITNYEP